jgi:hypothetical protein
VDRVRGSEAMTSRMSTERGVVLRLATVRDRSRPVETVPGTEPVPTEAELERGILEAIRLGALDVASALSERLAKRQTSGAA